MPLLLRMTILNYLKPQICMALFSFILTHFLCDLSNHLVVAFYFGIGNVQLSARTGISFKRNFLRGINTNNMIFTELSYGKMRVTRNSLGKNTVF